MNNNQQKWNDMLRMLDASKQHLRNAHAHLTDMKRANGHLRQQAAHTLKKMTNAKFYKNIRGSQNANFLSGNTDLELNALERRGTRAMHLGSRREHLGSRQEHLGSRQDHRRYLANESAKEEHRIRRKNQSRVTPQYDPGHLALPTDPESTRWLSGSAKRSFWPFRRGAAPRSGWSLWRR